MVMHRYWIVFEADDRIKALLHRSFGVTTYSLKDAIELVSEAAYDNQDIPAVIEYTVDVDVRTLDPGHVRPNMGSVLKQGIWWPPGFNSYP